MLSEQIKEAIEKLKKNGRLVTNVYTANIINHSSVFLWNADAILLSYNDHGVNRLYYYAHKLDNIEGLIESLSEDEYVLEFMTKNAEDSSEVLQQLGFQCLAQMMRMSVRDVAVSVKNNNFASQYFDEAIGTFPGESLAQDINKVLWKVFDTRVSHLQDDDELKRSIEKREVLIHQNEEGSVDAVLQTIIQPQRFYINQVYNGADKSVIHSMMHQRLKEYIAAGGKYAYAWVDKNNIASVKFHQKYGLQHDGMWNMVYVLKRV